MSKTVTGRIIRKDGSHENVACEVVDEGLIIRGNVTLRSGDHLILTEIWEPLQYTDAETTETTNG